MKKNIAARIAAVIAAAVIAAGCAPVSTASVVSGSSSYLSADSLKFSFENSADGLGYDAPAHMTADTYRKYIGNCRLAQILAENDIMWSGSSFGMSVASALLNYDNDFNVGSYGSGVSDLSQLSIYDKDSGSGYTLREFIERCEMLKYSPKIARELKLHRDTVYKDTVPRLKNALESDNPPTLITLTGTAGSGESMHTVVPYAWRNLGQNLTRIYVYDPNDNDSEHYINTFKDGNNWYVSWNYDINQIYAWSSLDPLGSMSYMNYNAYYDAVKEPFSEEDKERNLLITDAMNFYIRDSSGSPVARVESGNLASTYNNDIFQVINTSVTESGAVAKPSKVMLWLPAEFNYTVTWSAETDRGQPSQGHRFTVSSYYIASSYDVSGDTADISVNSDGVISFDGMPSSATREEGMSAVIFSDVDDNSWYFDAVMNMSEKGIINGYDDGTFRPDGNVTRLEFAAMTLRALGMTLTETDIDADVAETNGGFWGNGYISAARAVGITEFGISADEWSREANRAEMAHIAVTAAQYSGGQSFEISEGLEERIADYSGAAASMFAEDIMKAYSEGIITGMDDGTFSGGSDSTRAQAAVVIMRVIEPEKRA